jgi:hypothetical protein
MYAQLPMLLTTDPVVPLPLSAFIATKMTIEQKNSSYIFLRAENEEKTR